MKKSTKKKSKAVTVKSKKASKPSLAKQIQSKLEKAVTKVSKLFQSQPHDLVSAITQDHEGLRNFISVLKDTKHDMAERRRAYELFSALLKSHTIAEENAVYKPIEKTAKADLVIRIEEGFVEHQTCNDIMARLEKTTDTVKWSAHANVLAELIEHHLDEEEEKMFPLIKKQISKKLEADLIVQYLDLRASTQKKVTAKNAGVLDVF